jgi:hypothetical protein
MHQATRAEYNILKITAPGRHALNKKYTNSVTQTLSKSGAQVMPCGDGESPISMLEVREIARSYAFTIGPRIVFITAHGNQNNAGGHNIEINKDILVPTRSLFHNLKQWITSPIYLFLASCHSGASEKDIEALPEGSIIFATTSRHSLGYGTDGTYIAEALAKLIFAKIPMDIAMYFFVNTYLTIHGNYQGNTPTLIIRGHGEIIQKTFLGLQIERPTLFDLRTALYTSRYTNFLSSILAFLLHDISTPKPVRVKLTSNATLLAKVANHISSRDEFWLDQHLQAQVTTALHNSGLLIWLFREEDKAIEMAKKHKINNFALIRCALNGRRYDLALYLIKTMTKPKVFPTDIVFEALDRPNLLQACLEQGANVNTTNPYSGTPILSNVSIECARVLLQAGANTNQVDNEDYTPIHTAIANNDVERFELLYRHHMTDRSVLTPDGQNYYDYAVSLTRPEIIAKFREIIPLRPQKRKGVDGQEENDKFRRLINPPFNDSNGAQQAL